MIIDAHIVKCIKPGSGLTVANFTMYVFIVLMMTFLSWNTVGRKHTLPQRQARTATSTVLRCTVCVCACACVCMCMCVCACLGGAVPETVHGDAGPIVCVRHVHHGLSDGLDHLLQRVSRKGYHDKPGPHQPVIMTPTNQY